MGWTHIYDLLVKLVSMFALIGLLFLIPDAFGGAPYMPIVLLIIVWITVYHLWLRTVSTWLYCRFRLKMHVTLQQARTLNGAFTPASLTQRQWLPMKEVRTAAPQDKFALATATLETWKVRQTEQQREQREEFERSPLILKLMTYTSAVLVLYLLAACVLYWPPATYAIDLYCSLFDTTNYPVMLIWGLMLLCVLVPVALVKKMLKR